MNVIEKINSSSSDIFNTKDDHFFTEKINRNNIVFNYKLKCYKISLTNGPHFVLNDSPTLTNFKQSKKINTLTFLTRDEFLKITKNCIKNKNYEIENNLILNKPFPYTFCKSKNNNIYIPNRIILSLNENNNITIRSKYVDEIKYDHDSLVRYLNNNKVFKLTDFFHCFIGYDILSYVLKDDVKDGVNENNKDRLWWYKNSKQIIPNLISSIILKDSCGNKFYKLENYAHNNGNFINGLFQIMDIIDDSIKNKYEDITKINDYKLSVCFKYDEYEYVFKIIYADSE